MLGNTVLRVGGDVQLLRLCGAHSGPLTIGPFLRLAAPWVTLPEEVLWWRLANWPRLLDQYWRLQAMRLAGRLSGYPFLYGRLFLARIEGRTGRWTVFGLASLRAVTTAARDEVVDEFDAATAAGFDLTTFNYHGIGTGATAAADTDTALQTELTTEYTGNVRATGTQSQPTSPVYQTLATNTLDSGTPAITEHGVLTQAATGGGTLLDRHTFAAINLDGTAGDALQSTYQLTIASGG